MVTPERKGLEGDHHRLYKTDFRGREGRAQSSLIGLVFGGEGEG